MAVESRTYKRRDSAVFCKTHEENGGLSNMAAGFPLRVNGVDILTSEALYQACRFPHLPDVQRLIIEQRSPMTAKMKSKPYRKDSRKDWDAVRARMMRWCLRVKLAQNWVKFRDLLLSTGDRPIVEESRKDDFWGAFAQDNGTLIGCNVLGRLLMELREELKKPTCEALKRVEPIPLPDFKLYGEPIKAVQAWRMPVEPVVDPDTKPSVANLWDSVLELEPEPDKVVAASVAGRITEPVVNRLPRPIEANQGSPAMSSSKVGAGVIRRLIEVDLPIARISTHARREKDMRRGHVPLLHIYPAARPPAACRAVICAALWPDPADEGCPQSFRDAAAKHLVAFAKRVNPLLITDEKRQLQEALSPESQSRWEVFAKDDMRLDLTDVDHQNVLRFALLDFIADFANWDNNSAPAYLETSRALTQAAHEALGGEPGTKPLVVDPFAGGGSIPLEALRVGADAFASDINPVAVLLNKVILEYVPKFGQELSNEVRKWCNWIKEKAERLLSEYYPKDADGAMPIAYLWARTIQCEGAGCGAEVPLIRSMWLAKKSTKAVALKMIADPSKRIIKFEIIANATAKDVGAGTIKRGSATCPCCGFTTPVKSVREQLKKRGGGAADARLICVVTTSDSERGRTYRLPCDADIASDGVVRQALKHLMKVPVGGLNSVPTESTLRYHSFVNRGPIYGINDWSQFYLPRQLLSLATYTKLVNDCFSQIATSAGHDIAVATQTVLALMTDKMIDLNTSLCGWQPHAQIPAHVLVRWAFPMVFDFAESCPLAGSSGSPDSAVSRTLDGLKNILEAGTHAGHAEFASALASPLPDGASQLFFTDPPYYYTVQYADVMDFFYVWLRRMLSQNHTDLFRTEVIEKKDEIIVQSPGHANAGEGKNNAFYEKHMSLAMAEGMRTLMPGGIGVVVFAHTSTAGWEALLQSLLDAGWMITASWPIDTEMGSRVTSQGRSVLGSSVHIVCRPRTSGDPGDWRDVLNELPKRMHEWMPRLASEGVVGADAIFACLGPALEIFSRYSRVDKANGDPVLLKEYLEHVWAAVSKEALSTIFRDADASGLEPEARLTAMWLWTLGGGKVQPTKEKAGDDEEEPEDEDEDAPKATKATGFSLEFDAARKIAQGLGIHLEKSESIVEVKGEKARLLAVAERTKHLFGKDSEAGPTTKKAKKPKQGTLFEVLDEAEEAGGGWKELKGPPPGTTVLDRLHQAMILFGAQRGELLKRFLVEDGVGKDARFWKLAQSLAALYPTGTDERRWVEGVLARKKGLGL